MEELDKFGQYLIDIKKDIENGMESLEKGKKSRELKRKEFLALEVKQLLGVMAKNDAKIVGDLKGEAFDMLQSINKICDEASSMKSNVNVDVLKEKIQSLEVGEFLRSLNVTVSCNTDLLTSTVNKLSDAVFLNSPVLNPQHLFLQLPEKQMLLWNNNCRYVTINIFTASDAIKFTPLVMRNLHVEVESCLKSSDQGKVMLEETTVLSKMKNMKGGLSEDEDYVTIKVKRPRDGLVRISVKALGSNIVNSPIIYEFNNCHDSKDISKVNDSLGLFYTTGLDDSDLASLDMTRRRQILLSVGKNNLLSNPLFPASPAISRKVSKEPNISSVPELPTLELEPSNSPAVVTLPLFNPVSEEHVEDNEEGSEDDPHLMLNASKAPSPQSARCWQKEDSVWDNTDTETAEREPCWSNTSMLPDSHQVGIQDVNQTVWGEEVPYMDDNVDFLTCSIEVENVFKSQKVAESSSRGATYCLESPCSVAYLPTRQFFLVTEPAHHRIGLYEGSGFQFVGWLGYPSREGARRQYTYPTSVLTLSNGCLALLEKDRLHIFDGEVRHLQSIRGVFHGLAEGSGGEIYTLSKNKTGEMCLKKVSKDNSDSRSRFKICGQIKLSVIQTFNDWKPLSKTRFLTYSNGKVMITDLGLHKLYMIDLVTGEQTASGYMGTKVGQFQRPTGVVADEWGNLVVGDSENNRLVVFNKVRQLVKIVPIHQGLFFFPNDLLRVENSLLVVYMATKDSNQGAVVRYKFVPRLA